MVPLVFGFGVGAFACYATGLRWSLVLIFLIVAVFLQVIYAHALNAYLQSVGIGDPARDLGAKNLKELRRLGPVPHWIVGVSFGARALAWAGIAAAIAALGWLRIP